LKRDAMVDDILLPHKRQEPESPKCQSTGFRADL
jgi:hypothetical protein